MATPYEYAKNNADRYIEDLKALLRIPSISTMQEHHADSRQAAEWFRKHLADIGMKNAEVIDIGEQNEGLPIVYADCLEAGEDAPTVLVYGHYDVQPVDDPKNEWLSPPFEPTERDGKLYARGATDDKGQTMIQVKALESLLKTQGKLPVNVKVMLEGEEESGSKNLPAFIKEYTERLGCDVCVISDTHILSATQPSITYSLRGMVYTEVEVWGPETDLHSGSHGGAVHNPVQALAEMIAKLHDDNGYITIPHFYDKVVKLTPPEREKLAQIPFSDDEFVSRTGVSKAWGESEFTIVERLGARPTCEINGIIGGWTGQGSKTVIGASALAKVSFRLVANQDPDEILQLFSDYIAEITPDTIRKSEVRLLSGKSPAALVPIDNPAMKVAAAAYKATFGVEPVYTREGGSIPVVGLVQKVLGVPVLLMGFGLPGDNLHAPNENLTLSMFHQGIQTMLHFYEKLPGQL